MHPTERFSDRADDYVTGRPSYPAAAIDALFEGLGKPASLTVVDLGAGTGISSRLLAATGASVIAVEPNAAMRERAAPARNLTWQDGCAERTGLPGGSADLVTVFQAFHWFDRAEALREMARVLRPGGRAALVYNRRDEADPFTAAYDDVCRRFAIDASDPNARRNDAGRDEFAAYPAWQSVHNFAFENAQRLDRGGLHARAASTSYMPKDGAAAAELRVALDALFETYADGDSVTMRMQTTVLVATTS